MNKSLPILASALLASVTADAARAPLKSGLDLTGFDRSVRPQDNLYGFAAGHWLASTQIPDDLSNYGSFTVLTEAAQTQVRELLEDAVRAQSAPGSDERKAADFYTSFMDTERVEAAGLAPLAAELARIEQLRSGADVVRYIGYDQTLGIGEPLAWSAPQDAGHALSYIGEIDQAGLSMPDRDYYLLDEPKYVEYRAKFVSYVASMLRLAGAQEAAAAAEAQQILQLETQLAQAQWTKVANRDPVKTYNKLSLEEATRLAPQIDWRAFFDALGTPCEQFVISQPSFVTAVGKMIDTVPISDWQHYFRYKLLDAYAPFLPASYSELHFDFHQHTLSGVQQQRPRWKRAVATLDANIGEIVGKLYVARHFTPEAKQHMQQLVGNLLKAYERSVDQLDWMSAPTRAQARLKLSKIMVKVGYPDHWRDYANLTIRADDLAGNVMRSTQFELRRQAQRLSGPVDRSEWRMTPQTVNAYYHPTMNEIVFPAAILQPPFYDAAADDAVNYGAIGAVIGHEISHGFDDQGRQFDADGNLRDWWLAQDAERFKARTSALVDQYAAYTVLDGQHVNGELTLGENIADLSGLAIAYKAYTISLQGHAAPIIDGFTGPQRFFLGWAQIWRRKFRDDNLRMRIKVDPHSPDEFRVKGAVSNNDAFYAAFDVGAHDQMYRPPAERVKIW